MEIPTTGETLDNIVCFWQPEKAVKAGDELDFRYRLYWSQAQPPVSTLAGARSGHPHRDGGLPRRMGAG